MKVRRAYLKLLYDGYDASKEIQDDLVSFSYTDNAHGVADDVSISLKDETGIWISDWFPEEGDKIRPIIHTESWRYDGDSQSLDCGSFEIDEPECSGPPSTMTINGNSMPTNSAFKDEKKTRAWSNKSLQMIASQIAYESGLRPFFDSKTNPMFKYQLQDKVSDAGFLVELCNDHGFGVKISDHQLILFNIDEYKAKESVYQYIKGQTSIESYNFKKALVGSKYSGVKIKYRDGDSLKWYKYIPDTSKEEKIYTIKSIADDYATAERMTMTKFSDLSDKVFHCSMTVTLNLLLIGAVCIDISGFGKYDGKYYLDKVTHSFGGGSTSSFEARKIVSKINEPVESSGPRIEVTKPEEVVIYHSSDIIRTAS